jgi:hypothetical protein
MAAIQGELIAKIEERVQSWGGYAACQVGITNDPERRVFQEHGVDKENAFDYVLVDAGTFYNARAVEGYFIRQGCSGAQGGGDADTKVVYAYRKTIHTNP